MAGQAMVGGVKTVSASREERKPKHKKVKHMELSRAKNGGYLVKHHFMQAPEGGFEEPQEHVFGKDDGGEVLKHVARHLRIPATMPGKPAHAPVLGTAAEGGAAHGGGKKKKPMVPRHKAKPAAEEEPDAEDMDEGGEEDE